MKRERGKKEGKKSNTQSLYLYFNYLRSYPSINPLNYLRPLDQPHSHAAAGCASMPLTIVSHATRGVREKTTRLVWLGAAITIFLKAV